MPWPFYFDFRKSGFDRYRIEFRHPDTGERIAWQGERHFSPILIDFVGNTPYLVVYGRPDKSTADIYGCPELPYIYLQYTGNGWKPVPIEQAPIELPNANLSVFQVWVGYDGRHFSQKEVAGNIRSSEHQSDGQLQAKIPRTYDEWHTKYKNSARNERLFGDCRPPPKPLPDVPLPKPVDIVLEAVESTDYFAKSADEYYRSLWERKGPITRTNCSVLFKPADLEDSMLGERFINDPTGSKRPPYSGPTPFPSGRMLETRAERHCDGKFVWFVAAHEELGKTFITKYTASGDFLYNARMVDPRIADNKLYRGMILDSISVEDGYFYFYWVQSLPMSTETSKEYLNRMTKFRFQEPMQEALSK